MLFCHSMLKFFVFYFHGYTLFYVIIMNECARKGNGWCGKETTLKKHRKRIISCGDGIVFIIPALWG